MSAAGGEAVALEPIEIVDQHGRTFVRARVPRIERQFSSSLHTVASMSARVGSWRAELAAFQRREIPTAQLRVDASYYDPHGRREHDDLRRAVIAAIEEGYAGGVAINSDGELAGRLALPDAIAETVDLVALERDWRAWLDAAGALDEREAEQIHWAIEEELRHRTYADFLWRLGDLSSSAAHRIVHTVVAGDDPAVGCAWVLKEITGDTRYWEPVRG